MCFAISARSGAPNDGTGKGDISDNPIAYSRSKQNSDAAGMLYQWGRKDPFTFATSSLKGGAGTNNYGKYPVKIYNGKSELIYQEDGGGGNIGMTPVGGVIVQFSSPASSMMEIVKKPNLFCGNWGTSVISQVGHSKELWDYYWTSYSRGSDGRMNGWAINYPAWHNTYLDGYMVLRSKSIYDPCPYGYRTPTNGIYNNFTNSGWTAYSYAGGRLFNNFWYCVTGWKIPSFQYCGYIGFYISSTTTSNTLAYMLAIYPEFNYLAGRWSHSYGVSVRCIEDDTAIPKSKALDILTLC